MARSKRKHIRKQNIRAVKMKQKKHTPERSCQGIAYLLSLFGIRPDQGIIVS